MNAGTTVHPPPDRTDAAPATISSASLDSGKYGREKSMLAVDFCWGAYSSSSIDRGHPFPPEDVFRTFARLLSRQI